MAPVPLRKPELLSISSQTKYVQLKKAIAELVAQGEYAPGDRIPSIQTIMSTYNVAQGTAVRAIEMLADEGVLIRRPRVGVFVADRVGNSNLAAKGCSGWATDLVHRGVPPPAAFSLDFRPVPPDEVSANLHSLLREMDVIYTTSLKCTDRAASGDLLPLDDFLAEAPFFAESFEPAAMRVFRHGGATYAIPVYVAPIVAHLNLDAFAFAGVEPPPPDWTWDGLENVLLRLKAAGCERPLAWPSVLAFWLPFMLAKGEGPWEPATDPVPLDTPAVFNTLSRLKRLSQEFCPPSDIDAGMLLSAFIKGLSPILFWGAGHVGKKPPFRNAVLPLPGFCDRPTVVQAEGLGIPSGCPDPELAWRAICHFTGPEASACLVDQEIMFPPRQNAILDFIVRYDKGYCRAYRALRNATTDYLVLGQKRADVMCHALDGWWEPGDDLTTRLRSAQNVMDTVLGAAAARSNLHHL